MKYPTAILSVLLLVSNHVQAGPATSETSCALPDAAGTFKTVNGAQVNIDQAIVDAAIKAGIGNGTVSLKVFRNNCLVASSQALDASIPNDGVRKNLFSATKSVISILVGIAYDRGLLKLDDPIDKYLPKSILDSWGDAAHRAITIRQLLTESAGMAVGVISEALTVLLDVSLPQEALAQPLVNKPGAVFQYSQRGPDLLAYIVSRAVNQELQAFAQANLFTPMGIPADRYTWLRDRSMNSYGYAWLYMTPDDFARLGLLMQNGGTWNNVRILSESYSKQVSVPSSTNGCYGLLFWTNQVSPTSPNVDSCIGPTGHLFNRSWFPSAPRDLFSMAGSPQQKNYIIPSLNMTISWMAIKSNTTLLDDTPYYNFFKAIMPAIRDTNFAIPGPGTYSTAPFDLAAVLQSLNLAVLLGDLAPSPTCNIVFCNGQIPFLGLISNIFAILKAMSQGIDISALNNMFQYLTI